MSSEREPLLPTNAQQARQRVEQYSSNAARDAKATARHYGVNPDDIEGSARQIAPSRQTLAHIAQMVGAIKAGKLPSQKQINQFIEAVMSSPVLDERNVAGSTKLSQQGAKVLQDIKGILACIERIGESKNGDDKIQKFIYQTSQASINVTDEGGISASLPSASSVGADGRLLDEAKKDANKALGEVKQMAQLLITSKAFRDLLADIQFLLRDLTADAAATAAQKAGGAEGKLRPSEEERKKRGDAVDIRAPSKKDLENAKESAKRGAKQAQDNLQDSAKQAIGYLDEKTPDDVKDEFLERVKQIVDAVERDPEFKDALNGLYAIANKWTDIVQDVAEKAKEQTDIDIDTPEAEANENMREAFHQLKDILETFAGRSLEPVEKSVTGLLEHAKQIYDNEASKESKELRDFVEDVKDFINRALNEDGFIQTNRSNRMASDLYDRAQKLFNATGKEANKQLSKLRGDFDQTLDEIATFVEGLEEDPELRELGQRIEKLGSDLNFFDFDRIFGSGPGQGLINLFNDLRSQAGGLVRDTVEVFVPRIINEIQSIPFPRIEFVSREADVVIDDLSLTASTASFVPDRIRVVNRNDLTLDQRRSSFGSNFDAYLYLEIEGLRVKAADVAYYINKKTGWVGWEDYGFLDLDLGGHNGTSFVVKLENADEDDQESFYKVNRVSVDMSSFKVKVRKTKHWFLNFFLMPFVRPVLKRVFQQLLEEQIKSWLQNQDRSLWAAQQRAKVINSYSKTAVQQGQGVSPKAYLKAIFAPETDAFEPYGSKSKQPRTEVGLAEGFRVQGPHNEFKLAIGASYSKQLLPGKGGPLRYAKEKLEEYKYIEDSVRQGVRQVKQGAQELREGASEAVDEVRKGVKGLEGEAKGKGGKLKSEADKLSKESKKQERKEKRESGWRSSAFDWGSSDDVDL
ncbi:Protein of unknown function DUF4449 [Kalmanozyma brasiliensis GHG001]|uniref:Uncharacterized protein n=1 Tax=Kalmanozyma brasiliensis (strain GHG001) TaxID=1365824 RepID=V5ER42_KALBG|nr:Protein of unknown function DUF4449 [Kalmanozyma brasiliensis GHG001]EST07580.1 Protein of unknown function DUF4449 [Kalmanozyma brasiliensis GHG001]